MTTLDILVIICLIGAFLLGMRRGILARLARLAALLVGIIGTRIFQPLVLEWLAPEGLQATMLDNVLSYAGTFIVIYVIVLLATSTVAKGIRLIVPGILDRVCGALFNVMEWAMVLSIILNLAVIVYPSLLDRTDDRTPAMTEWTLDFAPTVLGAATNAQCSLLNAQSPEGNEDATNDSQSADGNESVGAAVPAARQ